MKKQRLSIKSEIGNRKSEICGLQPIVHSLKSKVFPIPHSRAAFTLMELLVVLAIIGLLTGMLFPALMGARERAKVTRARSEVQTLQQAWLAYWNIYGKWPAGVVSMNADAVAILAGVNTTENPYKIAFMEFDEGHLTYGFRDPWGKNYYRMTLTDIATPDTEVQWHFTTRAHCANAARYKY